MKENGFAVCSQKLFPSCFQCVLAVFDVFDRFLLFVLFGRICRFQAASFTDFWSYKLFFVTKLFFDNIKIIRKQFSVFISFFQSLGSIFNFCAFWPFLSFCSEFLLLWSVLDKVGQKEFVLLNTFFATWSWQSLLSA